MKTKTKTIKNDDINIIGIFCIVDDVLKNLGLKDDVRAHASNSEIITIAILAFLFFGGNFKKALSFILQQNLLFEFFKEVERFSKQLGFHSFLRLPENF
jgi:hypothetical protein